MKIEHETLPAALVVPPRTVSGKGCLARLPSECRAFGQRGMIVHGRSLRVSGLLDVCIGGAPAPLAWEHPGGEPTLSALEDALSFARRHDVHWIAGVGGGSVMDLAKACAGLYAAPLPVQAYHDGAPIPPARVPFIAVPSTAGTGSEATVVSVLTNETTTVKKSIRHETFMARVVLLDPDLLVSCPRAVAAASGMDAYTQAVESFFSRGATWFSGACAERAIRLIARSLPAVGVGGGDDGARRDMLEGSYLAGLALSHARLGVVHGLAHPLGARYRIPHGVVCAVCLPHALRYNRDAAAEHFDALAALIDDDPVSHAEHLLLELGIASPFAGLLPSAAEREAIVQETLASGSTKANPRAVTPSDAHALLDRIFAPSARGDVQIL